jgi:hypothetical protein
MAEMKLKQGPISESSLIEKLATAKKLMEMNGDSSKNTTRRNTSPVNESNYSVPNYSIPNYDIDDEDKPEPQQLSAHERISSSRLPENIKKAFMDSPMIQPPSLSDTIDMSFFDRAQKLMESSSNDSPTKQSKPQNHTNSDLIKALTPIIENIISKTLNKIVDAKLEKLLTAQESVAINENLVLKVGDSIFRGKITDVKNTKK